MSGAPTADAGRRNRELLIFAKAIERHRREFRSTGYKQGYFYCLHCYGKQPPYSDSYADILHKRDCVVIRAVKVINADAPGSAKPARVEARAALTAAKTGAS